jgi:transketolase
MIMKTNDSYIRLSNKIRKKILEISFNAKVGHVGSAFSIVEILVAFYFGILRITKKNTRIVCTDAVILSKGHAAPALYSVLNERGMLADSIFSTYCSNGSLLEEHPNHVVPGVDVSTGSLGHGLSIGVGIALAAKVRKQKKNVFVILSDAECDEGETWEAALSAAQYKLDNLYVFLDYNRVQAFGTVKDVLNLEPLAQKWKSFNWGVTEVDGHSVLAILAKYKATVKNTGPSIIICHTVRGKGVGFMEQVIDWHYKHPSAEDRDAAILELTKAV